MLQLNFSPMLLLFSVSQWFHLQQTSAKFVDDGSSPEFTSAITNVTVPVGRDATFTCNVKGLGSFKVGWVKADSKAIQAIHDAVITHNARVGVSGDLHTTFNLHIASVKEEDRGQYMCQINTDPMTYQTATLDVMVPPDITQSSPDLELRQGETAKLECRADGYPGPKISWKREDNGHIKANDKTGGIKKFRRFEGTSLTIPAVTPEDMGAYLCIATNDVPPARSKRVYLYVQFAPTIHAKEQLVGFTHGKDVSLKCTVSAYPRPIVYWNHTAQGIIVGSDKFELSESQTSPSELSSTLTIRSSTAADMGKFECVAKNSIGVTQAVIRTYLVATPSPLPRHHTSSATITTTATSFAQEKEEKMKFEDSKKSAVKKDEWNSNFYSAVNTQYEIVVGGGAGDKEDRKRMLEDENSFSGGERNHGHIRLSKLLSLLSLLLLL